MVSGEMSPSRGSVFTCRNVTILVVLLVIIAWYLPKLRQHSPSTLDGWTMYPRRWVTVSDKPPSDPQNSFTVVTYNVLNSGFIVPGTYSYCPRELIDLNKRHPRIMIEVQTMNPDIISMMEVDTEYYTSHLNPDMLRLGYTGVLSADDKYSVGQATFWKQDKFRLLHREFRFFHNLAKKYVDEAVIKKTLKPEEKETFFNWMKRRSLILITHLRDVNSGSRVLVGAVHITWDILQLPALQMLEVALGIQALHDLSQSTGTNAIIMMGDYNTPPNFPAYSFLRDGRVTDNTRQSVMDKTDRGGILTPEMQETIYKRLVAGRDPAISSKSKIILPPKDYRRYGKSVLDMIPEAFKHPLSLSSAYFTALDHEPEITNADDFDSRAGVKGVQTYTLDYIWFNNKALDLKGVLETPPSSTILKHTGLPSELFPSDHLPLKAEFSFKR